MARLASLALRVLLARLARVLLARLALALQALLAQQALLGSRVCRGPRALKESSV